jgi:alkylation response protein AidB-like acyl-CoA dehydrogenase
LLNGTKNWITNGSLHPTYLVITKQMLKRTQRYQCFIVEKRLVLILDQKKEKWEFGSDTHSLMFTVKVPKKIE